MGARLPMASARVAALSGDEQDTKTTEETADKKEEVNDTVCTHVPFNKDCADCQAGGLRRRQHRRTGWL